MNPWKTKLYFIFPLLAYCGIYLLATLFSLGPLTSWLGGDTYQGLWMIFSLAVFFMLSVEVFNHPQNIEAVTNLILLVSFPVAVYGILQFFGLDPLVWQTTSPSRVHSTVGYSLSLGTYLAMVVPFTLGRLFNVDTRANPRKMAGYVLLLFLQVTCLLFTLSRGALLALMVGSLVFLAALAGKSGWFYNKRPWLLAGLAGALLVGVLAFLTVSSSWGSFLVGKTGINQQQFVENRQVSNTGRLALWRLSLPMITERPLFGYGPDTYALAFIQHYPQEVEENNLSLQYWDAHNLVLSQAMSAGLLGLAAFLGVVGVFFWRTLGRLRRANTATTIHILAAVLASASAYLVQAQFNPAGVVPTILFWLVMAMGVGTSDPFPLPE